MEVDWTSAKKRVKVVERETLGWNPQVRKSSGRPRTCKTAICEEGVKECVKRGTKL
jgi:hypothetical protein